MRKLIAILAIMPMIVWGIPADKITLDSTTAPQGFRTIEVWQGQVYPLDVYIEEDGAAYTDLSGCTGSAYYGGTTTNSAYVTINQSSITSSNSVVNFEFQPSDLNTNGTFEMFIVISDAGGNPFVAGKGRINIKETSVTGDVDPVSLLTPLDFSLYDITGALDLSSATITNAVISDFSSTVDTDSIEEGDTNLYYTGARAEASLADELALKADLSDFESHTNNASAHHARYTDAEATGAVSTAWSDLDTDATDDLTVSTSFGGEVSGVYSNLVIGNDALDDQYYDAEIDLTDLLNDNYLQITNNLSDVASAGTARSNLGLAIGSDVQSYDAQLDEWSGVSTSSYYTTTQADAADTTYTNTDASIMTSIPSSWLATNDAIASVADVRAAQTNDGYEADTTYTAGDALTLDDTEFDFDGGNEPTGDLGGTWDSPTVDSGIHDDEYIELGDSFSGDVSGVWDNLQIGYDKITRTELDLSDIDERYLTGETNYFDRLFVRNIDTLGGELNSGLTGIYADETVTGAVSVAENEVYRLYANGMGSGTITATFEGDETDEYTIATSGYTEQTIYVSDGVTNMIVAVDSSSSVNNISLKEIQGGDQWIAGDLHLGGQFLGSSSPITQAKLDAWGLDDAAEVNSGETVDMQATTLSNVTVSISLGGEVSGIYSNLVVDDDVLDDQYLQITNNLNDLADAGTARGNLGLGTASASNATDFATGAEGDLAESATQPEDWDTLGEIEDVTNTNIIDSTELVGGTDHQFPVFTIPLSYWNSSTNYTLGTEIELKASTNNFATGLQYWCDSLNINLEQFAAHSYADHKGVIYFSDPGSSDRRQLQEISVQDLEDAGEMLTDYIGGSNLYSGASVMVVPNATNELWSGWMTEANSQNITWMWRARTETDNGPTDSDGDMIWYPIRPDEWVSSQEIGQNADIDGGSWGGCIGYVDKLNATDIDPEYLRTENPAVSTDNNVGVGYFGGLTESTSTSRVEYLEWRTQDTTAQYKTAIMPVVVPTTIESVGDFIVTLKCNQTTDSMKWVVKYGGSAVTITNTLSAVDTKETFTNDLSGLSIPAGDKPYIEAMVDGLSSTNVSDTAYFGITDMKFTDD